GRARARIRRLIATLARRAPRTAVAPAAAATRSIARDAGGRLRRVAAASVTEVPDGLDHRGHRPRGILVVPEHAQRLRCVLVVRLVLFGDGDVALDRIVHLITVAGVQDVV